MTYSLLSIGEAMAELRQTPSGGFDVGFAGDTYNTAVYCARALSVDSAGSVGYVTCVGYDPLSQAFVSRLESEQICTKQIVQNEAYNLGIYSVSTDTAGERSFHYWRNSSAARQLFSAGEGSVSLPDARIIYLSGISLAIMSPAARRRLIDYLKTRSHEQSLIAFDSNYRPKLWESKEVAQQTIAEMWEFADIALPSIDDEMDLFDDKSEMAVIERFSSGRRVATAIKRGHRGPVSPQIPADNLPLFAQAEKVIDTTAAGDSFNGAYLATFLTGAAEEECLLAGHRCASHVVGVRGAIAPS